MRTVLVMAPALLACAAASCGDDTEERDATADSGVRAGRSGGGADSEVPAGCSSNPADASACSDSSTGAGGAAAAPAADRCIDGCADDARRPVPTERPVCPTAEPSVGDACAEEGLLCGYGDAPTVQCRSLYECAGSWRLPVAPATWPCVDLPSGFCPDARPEHMSECTIGPAGSWDQPCMYDAVSCFCGPRKAPGQPGFWFCYGPPQDTACPAQLPNIGEGCDAQGTSCHYAIDCMGPQENNVFCYDGAWESGPGPTCFR